MATAASVTLLWVIWSAVSIRVILDTACLLCDLITWPIRKLRRWKANQD